MREERFDTVSSVRDRAAQSRSWLVPQQRPLFVGAAAGSTAVGKRAVAKVEICCGRRCHGRRSPGFPPPRAEAIDGGIDLSAESFHLNREICELVAARRAPVLRFLTSVLRTKSKY
jgi:hypothetical protein